MSLLWRSLLSVVGAFLLWRIAALGVSAHYVESLRKGDPDAAENALVWNDRQPVAGMQRALSALEEDPEIAFSQLGKVYAENPADARPLMALVDVERGRGDLELSDALVQQAVSLAPADAEILRRAGTYSAAIGAMENAVMYWSTALETGGISRERVFPALLATAESPAARGSFRPLLASPPTWWTAFFREVSRDAESLDTVRSLYGMRRAETEKPLTDDERKAYTHRLIRDSKFTEAYLVWINGLSEEERRHVGLLHNGGFEIEPTNSGFDWRLRKTEQVLITTNNTLGIDGTKALHLQFQSRRKPFRHVAQRLFLDPGGYTAAGMAKTERLESTGGLTWTVFCGSQNAQRSGESEAFLGDTQWKDFSFDFEVPESCASIQIQLRTSGKRPSQHRISGAAYFDNLSIRKVDARIATFGEDTSGGAGSAAAGYPTASESVDKRIEHP